LETLVSNVSAQNKLLEDIRRMLRGFQPLSLEPLERNYLEGLYRECNELRLIKEPRSRPGHAGGPRLQRVYVEVRTTAWPDDDLFCARLGIAPAQRERVQSALARLLAREGREPELPVPANEGHGRLATLAERLRNLDDKQMAAVVNSLNRQPAAVRAALATLTALDAPRAVKTAARSTT
jgi:hypothetical protein